MNPEAKGENLSVRLTVMLAVALAIAVAVVGAGCGGSSDSSASKGNGSTSAGSESNGEPSEEAPSEGQSSEEEESNGSSEGGSPDRAAFIKEASAVCKEARENAFERITAYEEKHGGKGEVSAALGNQAIRAVLISTIGREIAGLERLSAPAGDEQEVEAMISEMQSTLNKAKADKKLAYNEIEESFAAADKKLEAYGLGDCTKNGQE